MYEVDGNPLFLQPESGQWLGRDQIGVDGQGRPIYQPTYSFQIKWGPMDAAEFNQLCGLFNQISITGTASIVLPSRCGEAIWTGTLYTGVLFEEPRRESFWQEHSLRPSVIVRNINA